MHNRVSDVNVATNTLMLIAEEAIGLFCGPSTIFFFLLFLGLGGGSGPEHYN